MYHVCYALTSMGVGVRCVINATLSRRYQCKAVFTVSRWLSYLSCVPVDGREVLSFNRCMCGHIPASIRSFSAEVATPGDVSADLPLYSTPGSASVFSDIARMDTLSPRQLRILLQDAVSARVSDKAFWGKASSCCLRVAHQFKFFDALYVLECFGKMQLEDRTLVLEFSRHLVPQVSRMDIRHYIFTIDVFGRFGKFPEHLFMEVFHGLMRDCDKMYGSEYASVFLCLSRWDIRHQQLLSCLCRALCKNVSLLRYVELCQVASCARSLDVADATFYMVLDEWQRKELSMLTFQELLDAAKCLRVQEIKWAPYEDLLLKEFLDQSKMLDGSVGISQLADPFDCLNFLCIVDGVSKEFLLSLSKWCADAVHNPPTRSQKRPESRDLVHLYNLLDEYNVDKSYIDKAILKFVTSSGGLQLRPPTAIATQYKPNRKYFYAHDPAEPNRRRVPLKLTDDDLDEISAEDALKAVSNRAESEHINAILDEMDPIPRGIEFKKVKKPSTQSCGKASFRLRPKTSRHKNVAASESL